jgi:hypothetical protein
MNYRFDPLPVKPLPPHIIASVAFSGAIVVDLLPCLMAAFFYDAVARVVSR